MRKIVNSTFISLDGVMEHMDTWHLMQVGTPRARLRARLRISGIRDGVLFVPFHYGYWDASPERSRDHDRAANELTPTDWDPVSKQPLFKTAAANLTRVARAEGAPSAIPNVVPLVAASRPVTR